MRTNARFPVTQIEAMAREFDELPAFDAEDVSAAQAIQRMTPQILAMRSKGYAFDSIAALLASKGVVATAAAIRANLRRARLPREKAKAASTKAKRSAERAATTAASARVETRTATAENPQSEPRPKRAST